MQEAETAYQRIEESFDGLRRAVESRDYKLFDSILQEQRKLMQAAPSADPRTFEVALRGRELMEWAITMVKIQRAGYARSLATILNAKHLGSSYTVTGAKSADVISLQV